MELYRFEVVASGEVIHVVIAASSEEQAFRLVEVELEKYFLRLPEIEEITLYEKKKIHKGAGFVIYEQENILK
ncbi:DUF3906 family protein [Ectobacillus panaciterrae]|uniref:DUF3906 family protein n=1 Tax=Ectobacillus panaciterrae TaxID=363872 RepID=UPI000419FA5E|nr:DUF3906 family protein [Ectobacillus panaciterrae]